MILFVLFLGACWGRSARSTGSLFRALHSARSDCGTMCPGGCCGAETDWVCCPGGQYCAEVASDCPDDFWWRMVSARGIQERLISEFAKELRVLEAEKGSLFRALNP